MSHRDTHHEPLVLDRVIELKGETWSESTRKVARADAFRVLEALVAEVGVARAVRAMDKQGFEGRAYRYLLGPLHDEATRRRLEGGGTRD